MQLIFNFPNRGQRSKSTHRRGSVGVKRHGQHRKKRLLKNGKYTDSKVYERFAVESIFSRDSAYLA